MDTVLLRRRRSQARRALKLARLLAAIDAAAAPARATRPASRASLGRA
jgi:hypothetical protein